MNCNETLTILRWFRPSENYNFWENFKKNFFCQIDIMIHFFYTKFIEESEYRIQFDKKSTQHLLYSFFWDLVFEKFVKNSWRFFSNTFIILSLQFELFFALSPLTFIFSIHHCPRSLFPCEHARHER